MQRSQCFGIPHSLEDCTLGWAKTIRLKRPTQLYIRAVRTVPRYIRTTATGQARCCTRMHAALSTCSAFDAMSLTGRRCVKCSDVACHVALRRRPDASSKCQDTRSIRPSDAFSWVPAIGRCISLLAPGGRWLEKKAKRGSLSLIPLHRPASSSHPSVHSPLGDSCWVVWRQRVKMDSCAPENFWTVLFSPCKAGKGSMTLSMTFSTDAFLGTKDASLPGRKSLGSEVRTEVHRPLCVALCLHTSRLDGLASTCQGSHLLSTAVEKRHRRSSSCCCPDFILPYERLLIVSRT